MLNVLRSDAARSLYMAGAFLGLIWIGERSVQTLALTLALLMVTFVFKAAVHVALGVERRYGSRR